MTLPSHELGLDELLNDQPALRARLRDADAAVRRIALLDLADQEDERLLPWLLRLLRDEAPGVRVEAARRLAAWERADSVGALVAALDDADADVAEAAAQSLAELKDPGSGTWVLPALGSARAFVRARALRALRELRLPASLAPASALLGDPHADVRREAVGVVGWLKPAEALPRLAEMACDDASADVRRAAVAALGFVEGGDPAVLAALRAALGDAEWSVREEAATTVGKLRWADALPALVSALSDSHWQVALRAARGIGRLREAGGSAWPSLVGLLEHPLPNLRKEAAIALGELRRPEALPALERAAQDADPDVRKLARLALAAIGQDVRPVGGNAVVAARSEAGSPVGVGASAAP